MKSLLLFALILLVFPLDAQRFSLDTGISLYENKKYDESLKKLRKAHNRVDKLKAG